MFDRDGFSYDVEIVKSYEDENGDYIVEGIASNGMEDQEGEIIVPEGLDYSYFLTKGFIKWEHSKDPRNFIGEPIEAGLTKNKDFYIKGRLYRHAPLAQQAIEALKVLEKSNARRKLGFSIEGSVLQRDPKNPKRILKAIVRNVALTFNPVNDGTWAALAKSLDKPEALSFAIDEDYELLKSLPDLDYLTNEEIHVLADYVRNISECPSCIESLEKSYDPKYQEPNGQFKKMKGKNGKVSRFAGCVKYFMNKKGLSEDSATRLCGYIKARKSLILDIVKALNTETGQAVIPESLEKDPVDLTTERRKKKFQRALLRYLLSLLKQQKEGVEKSLAMAVATANAVEDLTEKEAEFFINEVSNYNDFTDIINKSLGGEIMPNNLEDLIKSLEDSMEELNKSIDEDYEDEDEKIEDDAVENEEEMDDDEVVDEEEDDEEEDDEEEDDEDEEETEKSFMDELLENEIIQKALEISDFLEIVVGAISESMDNFSTTLEKSLEKTEDINQKLAKSLISVGEITKSLYEKVQEQEEIIKSLTETVEKLANQPVGRKSIVDSRELVTIQKSFGVNQAARKMTKAEVVDLLVKGFEKGEIDAFTITKFETTGILDPAIKQKLGIEY